MMVDLAEHAALRGEVQVAIRNCTSCVLRAKARPVPFRGPTPNKLAIVGEAPGYEENLRGAPFVGNSGKLLERILRDVKLPPLAQWFICNTVSCYPHGTPDALAVKACRTHLKTQIALCDPEIVVTLGAIALASVEWTSEKITRIHGRPFRAVGGPFKDRLVFPTFHPAAGLRDPKKLNELRSDLSTLSAVIAGKLPLHDIEVRIGRRGKIAA